MPILEWGDTFDHYTKRTDESFSASFAGRKWTSQLVDATADSWEISPRGARPGAPAGNGARVGANTTRHWLKLLPGGALATRCISVWFNPSAANTTTGQPIVAFFDAAAEQCSVRLDSSARIIVTRGATLLFTSTNTISTNTWYHLQFKATIHNTTGVYEVRVNGTSTGWVPQQTGANTRGTGTNNSATQTVMGCGATGWMFDDFIVADDFTGPLVGAFLAAAAPGNYQAWTANSGNRQGAVRSADDDASFVASTTSGNIDSYVLDKLPADGTPTILGIQHVIYAKQDGGVQRTLRPKQRSGSTDHNGTSVNTGASYALITEAVSTNPATSAAYTKTSLESAEFGYENV